MLTSWTIWIPGRVCLRLSLRQQGVTKGSPRHGESLYLILRTPRASTVNHVLGQRFYQSRKRLPGIDSTLVRMIVIESLRYPGFCMRSQDRTTQLIDNHGISLSSMSISTDLYVKLLLLLSITDLIYSYGSINYRLLDTYVSREYMDQESIKYRMRLPSHPDVVTTTYLFSLATSANLPVHPNHLYPPHRRYK